MGDEQSALAMFTLWLAILHVTEASHHEEKRGKDEGVWKKEIDAFFLKWINFKC